MQKLESDKPPCFQKCCWDLHDTKGTEQDYLLKLEKWIIGELAKLVTHYLFAVDIGMIVSTCFRPTFEPRKTSTRHSICDPVRSTTLWSFHGTTCLNLAYEFRLGPIQKDLSWSFGSGYGPCFLRCTSTTLRIGSRKVIYFNPPQEAGYVFCSSRQRNRNLTLP